MSAIRSSVVCERVRSHVSLALDGELSQLERRMLASHLLRCAECDSYSRQVNELTAALRQAPLEPLERQIMISRPRRVSFTIAQAGVAATLAVAALGMLSQVGLPGRSESASQPTTRINLFKTAWQPERELAQIGFATTARPRSKGPETAV
jgi:predicted anti-sigma-YlaC factor YlaD